MGVYTFTVVDEDSSVAPHRLFMAMDLDNQNLLPKAAPQVYKSASFLEGDSTAVGAVKQFDFADGTKLNYAKIKIDELDADNYYIKYTNFESDFLGENLERIVYTTKVEATEAGSHYKMVGDFHTKGDIVITEGDYKSGLKVMLMYYKAVVQYLLNNPELYA